VERGRRREAAPDSLQLTPADHHQAGTALLDQFFFSEFGVTIDFCRTCA